MRPNPWQIADAAEYLNSAALEYFRHRMAGCEASSVESHLGEINNAMFLVNWARRVASAEITKANRRASLAKNRRKKKAKAVRR